ncbi:hypothetical protein PUR59_33945 [Streptomyces sp. SP18ES09]|uniref:hypothetical protein n=1 Tax=Streptomyces sp. SP18ES09 TaxID=3002532 RepID=UPI002E7A4410|nr:hypothetical protein [Streptomyces sp. SP18ES09]MEE1820004.1 hypothetical protein [Streptomyces sp. SP18ES09]
MDVERITEELYGLKPGDFVAARDGYVAEARAAKDPTAAKAIAALRRPATAAWAANRLARERPREAERFLALGETLREAHRTLDAERLRAASREQHQLVAALARTAAELAGEAGQPVSDTAVREIEQTLHGVLAHGDVADRWAKGRLVKVPEAAVGFPAIDPDAGPPPPARAAPRPARNPDLAKARAAAGEAAAEVARCEREFDSAERSRQAAAAKAEEAAERVTRLETDLAEARRNRTEAEGTASRAATALTTAERALARSRRAADRATRTAEALEGRAP